MTLLTAHKILITTAIVFFFGFAAWEFKDYLDTANRWSILRAAFYLLVAVGFCIYFRSMKKCARLCAGPALHSRSLSARRTSGASARGGKGCARANGGSDG